MKYYFMDLKDNLSSGFGGTAQGPFIKLLKKYKDDTGLIEHEKTHVRQWYVMMALGLLCMLLLSGLMMQFYTPGLWMVFVAPFLHQLLYKVVRPYRRWCEVKAYRKQIATGGYTSNEFAVTALAEKYDLGLSLDEARALLVD